VVNEKLPLVVLTYVSENCSKTYIYDQSSPEWNQALHLIDMSERLEQMEQSLLESTEILPPDS